MLHKLPLCPYGRVLEAFQNESIRLKFSIYIFVGKNAANEAYANKCAGVMSSYLPDHYGIEDFHWPIESQSIILFDTGNMTLFKLKSIAHSLLLLGAKSVALFTENAPIEVIRNNTSSTNTVYRKLNYDR